MTHAFLSLLIVTLLNEKVTDTYIMDITSQILLSQHKHFGQSENNIN